MYWQILTICWKLPVAKSYQPGQKHWNPLLRPRAGLKCALAPWLCAGEHLEWTDRKSEAREAPLKDSKIHVAYVAQVRVAPTGAEEPTMDLRKLPLGIDVADPEVGPA